MVYRDILVQISIRLLFNCSLSDLHLQQESYVQQDILLEEECKINPRQFLNFYNSLGLCWDI